MAKETQPLFFLAFNVSRNQGHQIRLNSIHGRDSFSAVAAKAT